MNERELYISNAGEAPNYFTDDMIDEMVSSIGSYLADQIILELRTGLSAMLIKICGRSTITKV